MSCLQNASSQAKKRKIVNSWKSTTFKWTLVEFPYKSFGKIVSGGSETEVKLPLAWQWLFLVYFIDAATRDGGYTSIMPNELDSTLNALRKIGILPIRSIGEFVTRSSKASFKAGIPEYFEFAFENSPPAIESDVKFIHVVSFLKKVLLNLT